MDIVLIGLPGSGKSAVGRRVARHGAVLIDVDELIEREAGLSVPEIFAAEGEAGFRARERAVIQRLGGPGGGTGVARVIATGGGAVIDPRNRWRLYRGRLAIWLDGRPEVLAQRLRRSPNVRPLVAGGDPIGAVRGLAGARRRFYAAAERVNGVADLRSVVGAVEQLAAEWTAGHGTTLLRAETSIGKLVLGDGIATSSLGQALDSLAARRAILVSEPGAWAAAGESIATGLRAAGRTVDVVMLPQGESAKRLSVLERAAGELAALRAERGDPLVAIGGGALGDTAGFLAATWLRGVPVIHVPTTLVAQIDSSIGGKTGVDIDAGKNLVGAFHQPASVVIDVAFLRTLPERERRAALAEAVKMGVLGDERLLELIEADGEAIARGDETAFTSGAIAELVERCAWAKVEVVTADERETGASGGRVTLNLGHSLGHAIEAAAGYRDLRHGEAIAFGLRAAIRIGRELDICPAPRSERIERLLDKLGLGLGSLPYPAARVLEALGADKKHAAGVLRWVLPAANGVVVRTDVPDQIVGRVLDGLLAGETVPA
jgi:3-dehydroquinate synthetase/shikimate kinase